MTELPAALGEPTIRLLERHKQKVISEIVAALWDAHNASDHDHYATAADYIEHMFGADHG